MDVNDLRVAITVAGLAVMMRDGLDLGRMRALVQEPAREEGRP